MSDPELHLTLVHLAEAIPDIADSEGHQVLFRRFFDVVRLLESRGLIDGGNWILAARR